MGGGNDPRKGIDLLFGSLSKLSSDPSLRGLQLVVFGQSTPKFQSLVPFPTHYTGHLARRFESSPCLQRAADALVIPSRIDNLPNTGLEAHA